MQIAIISDVHNNEVNLEKVLDYCQKEKIKSLVCCGDLASKETLDFMKDSFAGEIYYTFGNADYTDLRELEGQKKYQSVFLFKNFGEVEIEGKKIAFVHFPDIAKKLAESGKYDFVFYGHTHKPWEENIKKCKMLNPGNVAGEIFLPTFAIWDTKNDNFQLIRVHDLE